MPRAGTDLDDLAPRMPSLKPNILGSAGGAVRLRKEMEQTDRQPASCTGSCRQTPRRKTAWDLNTGVRTRTRFINTNKKSFCDPSKMTGHANGFERRTLNRRVRKKRSTPLQETPVFLPTSSLQHGGGGDIMKSMAEPGSHRRIRHIGMERGLPPPPAGRAGDSRPR